MTKIAISLPDGVFQAIERARKARGESRSEFLRKAVEAYFRREQERKDVEQYIRAYQQHPETEEEISLAESTAQTALAENPWEDGAEK